MAVNTVNTVAFCLADDDTTEVTDTKSSAWVGVLLFLGSSVVSIKGLTWIASQAIATIMQ